nr:TetR/AcrR family transcriptional regulator [Cellulosimicrobium arenosum]
MPLLVEHGTAVTTRQIAEAAGVAEGTLFRAFEDKDELLRAAVVLALDPQPLVDAIADVPGADLRELVRGLAHLLAEAQRVGMRVFSVAHQVLGARAAAPGAGSRAKVERLRVSRHGVDERQRANRAVVVALEARLSPHESELRVPPPVAAAVVSSLVFGTAVPHLTGGAGLEPDQVADLLLHGISEPTGTDPSP